MKVTLSRPVVSSVLFSVAREKFSSVFGLVELCTDIEFRSAFGFAAKPEGLSRWFLRESFLREVFLQGISQAFRVIVYTSPSTLRAGFTLRGFLCPPIWIHRWDRSEYKLMSNIFELNYNKMQINELNRQ